MTEFAGRGLRPRLRAACLLAAAAACLGLAACSSTPSKPQTANAEEEELPNKKGDLIDDLFGGKPFKEVEVSLPALPSDADLIPFEFGPTNTTLKFAVDAKSVLVGEDGAVRYTVVITSASGVRNTSFEALRCDTFERKLYATLPPGAKGWVRNRSDGREGWIRLSQSSRNNYADALGRDYLCDGRSAYGSAKDIVKRLRNDQPAQNGFR